MNNTLFTGRLCNNNELKYTNSGVAYLRNTIAVDRKYKDKDGNRKTDFFNFIVWRKPAEIIAQYSDKGDKILLSGEMQTDSYTNKEGQVVRTVNLNVDTFEFIETQKNKQQARPEQKQNEFYGDPFEKATDISDVDLPF